MRIAALTLLAAAALPLPQSAHAQASSAATPATQFSSDRIIVTTVGSGPDVVLVPGLSSSPEVWRTTVDAVPGYRYHLVQVKGFAGAAPEANASGPVVAPVAEEIARYIAEARLDRPAVVGHSLGGTLGMLVATRHPSLVGKLMVVDMLPSLGVVFAGPGATAATLEPIASAIRSGIAGASGPARAAQQEQTIAGMVRTESMRALAVRHGLDSDGATSGQAMYDLIMTDLSADLANYSGPMSVLWVVPTGAPVGQEAMAGFYRMAYARAPQARVTYIPDSAHFIMWDAPDRFRSELRAFLAD